MQRGTNLRSICVISFSSHHDHNTGLLLQCHADGTKPASRSTQTSRLQPKDCSRKSSWTPVTASLQTTMVHRRCRLISDACIRLHLSWMLHALSSTKLVGSAFPASLPTSSAQAAGKGDEPWQCEQAIVPDILFDMQSCNIKHSHLSLSCIICRAVCFSLGGSRSNVLDHQSRFVETYCFSRLKLGNFLGTAFIVAPASICAIQQPSMN